MWKVLRKSWPRIRTVEIKGKRFYRVDARRKGTNGTQVTFKLLKDAEDKAADLAKLYETNGSEGLAFSVDIRSQALIASKILEPYKKTLIQAAEFYKAHLDSVRQKAASALVPLIAKEWFEEKKSGKNKKLGAETLRGLHEASGLLATIFDGKRMLEVSTEDIATIWIRRWPSAQV